MLLNLANALRKLAMLWIGIGIVIVMLSVYGLLMMDLRDLDARYLGLVALFDLMVVSCATLVYIDARDHRIGPLPRPRGPLLVSDVFGLNMSPGAIGAFVVWWWVIILPLYLVRRRDLMERAKANPCEESRPGLFLFWITLFVVASPILVLLYQV